MTTDDLGHLGDNYCHCDTPHRTKIVTDVTRLLNLQQHTTELPGFVAKNCADFFDVTDVSRRVDNDLASNLESGIFPVL